MLEFSAGVWDPRLIFVISEPVALVWRFAGHAAGHSCCASTHPSSAACHLPTQLANPTCQTQPYSRLFRRAGAGARASSPAHATQLTAFCSLFRNVLSARGIYTVYVIPSCRSLNPPTHISTYQPCSCLKRCTSSWSLLVNLHPR